MNLCGRWELSPPLKLNVIKSVVSRERLLQEIKYNYDDAKSLFIYHLLSAASKTSHRGWLRARVSRVGSPRGFPSVEHLPRVGTGNVARH